MPLSAGSRLGCYEILAPIGAGGMGEVYRATDTRLGRNVAIKITKEQFSERFEREARAVAALNHPHICHLYDVGPNYLVMELVEGTPLKGPLPIDKAVEYAGQILDALDAAHKKGITHRDLKPANILVTKQGIKLLDFGLAKQTAPLKETDGTRALTGQGQILGTLQYMSPEQLQGKEVDARSDLFSFGCVLYEMLTGKRAFEGQSAASVMAAILEREPAPLEVARPVDRVIKRSLAKDPDQRFQTARDLKAALAWAMEQPPVVTSRPSRRWQWVAAVALSIGSLSGWALAHFRKPSVDERVLRVQIDPPEDGRFVFGSSAGGIALSPDGRTAAYIASINGKTALWVRPLDGTARLLAGTEGAYDPFWSPDGKSIGFFAVGKLQRVDLAGGAPLPVCDATVSRGGAWTSDGHILFGSTASGLFRVLATGGTPSLLTSLDKSDGENSHRWPQGLPGGRFLYWVRSDNTENTGIYAGSLAKSGERVKLLTNDTNAVYAPGVGGTGYLLWLRGATLVAQELNPVTLRLTGEPFPVAEPVARMGSIGHMNAAVSASGLLLYSGSNTVSQFTWVDRTGKPLGVVGEPAAYGEFRLSPDGGRIATTIDRPGRTDVWLLDVGRRISSRLTSASAVNWYPIWSPDGRTILFSSSGAANIFRKDSGGAGVEERVAQSPNTDYPTDWSRDGRVLYYELAPGTQRDLWFLPVMPDGRPAPNATPKPYLQTQFSESWGRFSPELSPHWVAYQSDETGRYEVYIQSFPEKRGAAQIFANGGQYPQWGPDGHELFYVSLDNKLVLVNLTIGSDSVKPSAPHELFPVPAADIGFSPYDIAPDGQRFLVRATPEKAAAPALTVIVNWPALLLRKGAAAQ